MRYRVIELKQGFIVQDTQTFRVVYNAGLNKAKAHLVCTQLNTKKG